MTKVIQTDFFSLIPDLKNESYIIHIQNYEQYHLTKNGGGGGGGVKGKGTRVNKELVSISCVVFLHSLLQKRYLKKRVIF